MQYGAWVYPGAPATDAPLTYRAKRLNILRSEYFTLCSDGLLKLIVENPTDLMSTANAFSDANIADIKAYSDEQYATVSGSDTVALRRLFQCPSAAIKTLCNFVVQNGITGIDIDFERISAWTSADFVAYKAFLTQLGNDLHANGKKLTVCTPVWTFPRGAAIDLTKPPYQWWYKELVSLPINFITPMVYDYQWDMGAGQPVTPIWWLTAWARVLVSLFGADRVMIGIPSYGHTGTVSQYDITTKTLDQVRSAGQYDAMKRDTESGEMIVKTAGGQTWVANDATSMIKKRDALVACGVTKICVWHLGGGNEYPF
ncbi:glycoside hydrolase superfamily [Blastocladiella britannica]|nr:glycoside hydrolase superfamily [Blastocladiella britannica]